MDTMDDAELLAATARGDADAFAAFYRRHLARVVAYALRATGDRELAADLTGEVFAAALAACARYRADHESAAPWLLGAGAALAAVEQLPADQRAAVRARIIEERGYAEIAAGLRCSESVVRQRVSRGLARMRTELTHLQRREGTR
jgi:RNA polymerase sigma-70 factor, ECF subfamily